MSNAGSATETSAKQWSDRDVDLTISYILRAGVILSSILVFIGGIIYLTTHAADTPQLKQFHQDQALRTVPGVFRAARSLDGAALMQLGVVILLLTPVLRVAFALYAFFRQRDVAYVVISSIVLGLLLFSVIGKH